ncbi:MAG TPA: cysteine desulfurase [Thermoplasmata archaeon]|nr:cysteine desulfurase [Thermoplasmata archaeon]
MELRRARAQFPALRARPGHPVPAYLDSACMSLVPTPVLDAMEGYYRDYPGCGGRSLHHFAEEVSHRFEAARDGFARFFHATDRRGIIFVRNATEAINLVANGFPWSPGDKVLVTDQEHNSNLIVWQRLAKERGIALKVLALPEDGSFDGEAFDAAVADNVRLVSMFHTSNLDGRSLPVREIVERAHARGAKVLIDGCQAAPHGPVDLGALGVDYYALSAHKMMGPTGTGVLAATLPALGVLRPLIVGGETVEWSTLEGHELRPPPHRFEGGLQNYAGVIGAGAALDFLAGFDWEELRAHDRALNTRVTRAFEGEPRLHVLGPDDPADRPSLVAFHVDGVDPNDAALFLDTGHGVLVRSGRHCVHSWYERRGLAGNVRASFYLYNTRRDADRLIAGVKDLLAQVPAGRSAPAGPPEGTAPAPAG